MYFCSNEDCVAIIKSSLHLLKATIISKKYKHYLKFLIKLVLAALSQIVSNENEDVKCTTKLLKVIINEVATKVCDKSSFIVQSKGQRQNEMQVRNLVCM